MSAPVLQQTATPRPPGAQPALVAGVSLALTLVLSVAAFLWTKDFVRRQERERFHRESSLFFEELRLGQQANFARLTAAQDRLSLGPFDVDAWQAVETRTEWKALKPWLRQMGWADAVPNSIIVRRLSTWGDPGPLATGQQLLDNPSMAESVRRLSPTRNRAVSAPLPLFAGTNGTPRLGVLVLLPVWENGATQAPDGIPRGYVVATIDPVGLFEASWARVYRILDTNAVPLLAPTNIVEVQRPGHTIDVRLLPGPGEPVVRDGLHPVRGDDLLGRTLHYALAPTAAFAAETPSFLPYTALWASLATGFLFSLAVTGQSRKRSKAEAASRELERRVAERTLDLAAANRDLEAAQAKLSAALADERELHRLKSNFVAMVSHEVRTPLATILSSSGLLQDYADRLPAQKRADLLQHIVEAAKQMAANMDNVLLLSRVESAAFEASPQRIALGDLCRQLANEVDSATHRRCPVILEIAGDAGGEATLDPAIFRHIFVNLLSNAVKYSPPQAPVLFRLRREGREAVLLVQDEGIGIPAADQARLFEAFRRGRNSGGTPGTGLGLVIVKRCVDMMGGRIGVQSVENEGTTVTVRLPVFDPAKESPTP